MSRINFTASIFFSIDHLPWASNFQGLIPLQQVDRIKLPDAIQIHDMLKIPAHQNVEAFSCRYGDVLTINEMFFSDRAMGNTDSVTLFLSMFSFCPTNSSQPTGTVADETAT